MSLHDYQAARSLIEEAGGNFEGAKSETLVSAAERALRIRFPPSYRQFLLELGCGDINGLEIYGLINDEFDDSSIPNGIWLTLNERKCIGLDDAYILIGEGGDGCYLAIDSGRIDNSGENPVIRLSVDGQASEPVAEDFGVYLLEAVRAVT